MEEKNAGRVFMLDDDLFFLELYRNLLEARGYEVFTETNAYKFLLYVCFCFITIRLLVSYMLQRPINHPFPKHR